MMDPVLCNDWLAVARSDQVAEGGLLGVHLLEQPIVLWRQGGQVLAWRDLCLHRGTRLSLGKVREGQLVCGYHGWAYGRQGRCEHIPAHPNQRPPVQACVHSYAVQERYGLVWVCLGHPVHLVPDLDLLGYREIVCGPYEFAASAPRVVENFLDVSHFPFVHDGLLGDARYPELPDYEVTTGLDGIVARDICVYQPDPDGSGKGAHVNYTYRVFRPLIAHLTKELGAAGQGFAILLAVCPVSVERSQAFMVIHMNYGLDIPIEELRAFQDKVVAQDRAIVESQRPELLPLDLSAELHLRSDRTAIAYRRWLRDLGLTFGTA